MNLLSPLILFILTTKELKTFNNDLEVIFAYHLVTMTKPRRGNDLGRAGNLVKDYRYNVDSLQGTVFHLRHSFEKLK